jgi:mono/diheme cytochrome c family protein
MRALLASALAGAALAACDQGSEVASMKTAGRGQVLYLTYCESCHGIDGSGSGRAAASLRTPPADLTRLFERYGTPLDRARIEEYIDGRKLTSFHGAREMPIWGEEFFSDSPEGTPNLETVRQRLIALLAEYLETLQAEQRT